MFDNVKVIPFCCENLIKNFIMKMVEIINRFTCHEMCEPEMKVKKQ